MSGPPLEYMTPAMATRLGSLVGTVTSVDWGTVMQQNMEYMRVKVCIPICRPLIPGAFLRLENGEPVWIQFGYERLFKVCFNCGCIGHLIHHYPYTFTQASNILLNCIHEASFPPHGFFWLAQDRELDLREVKAYKDSNRNRTTNIEILWAQDEPRSVLETESSNGTRTVYFVRNQFFSSPEKSAMEASSNSSGSGDATISVNEPDTSGGDNGIPHGSIHGSGPSSGPSSPTVSHSTSKTFGLDESFERAINLLGLTSSPENVSLHCKMDRRDGPILEQISPKRFKPT
ncbi:hypothetical protein Vadar_034047 [Vaccinium darrowii]|uniref:Uncharacterized protein n=1 Tax=Vaccinium darrowii TaxID=229202 RepID=A0ACB7YRS9_9ERIC|nr:hypothetical protein Vadar_034047 [Vaccinium darrowii]